MKDKKLFSIRKGCRLNGKIFSALLKKAMKGEFETELDVARFIKNEISRNGGALAFPPIVAIGKNAVDWHHRPTNTKLANGGFCVIDFGARFNRYCSDMTRTVYFGKAGAAERKIYAKVRRANEACITKVRSGIDGNKIYLLARKILGWHAKYFGHGLGHGLKKIIHAKPKLNKKPGQFLREGGIVTIEPGVYIPKKLGIRIEDDVLVTRRGCRLLSHSPKHLIEINLKK